MVGSCRTRTGASLASALANRDALTLTAGQRIPLLGDSGCEAERQCRDHLICRSSGDGLVVAAADRCEGVDVVADCADEQCRVVRCCQNVSAKFVDVQLVNGVVAEMNCSARRLDSTRQCVDPTHPPRRHSR